MECGPILIISIKSNPSIRVLFRSNPVSVIIEVVLPKYYPSDDPILDTDAPNI